MKRSVVVFLAAGLAATWTGCGSEDLGPASPQARVAVPATDVAHGGIVCSEVRAQLKAFEDGELSIDTRQRIADHLRVCESCMATTIQGSP